MNKNTFTAVQLAKGEVNVYDFETVKAPRLQNQ